MTSHASDRFRALHESGTFLMPNPFDVGSARLLAALGFPALATTSSGFAATVGRQDMRVTRDELLVHVGALAAATDLPLNVDAERCFAEDLDGVAETVTLLAGAGAAGCSIEDWNPAANVIDPIDVSVPRVAAAAGAARSSGIVLTARCENLLRGVNDLDATIARLIAYRDAGADVVYAPGLVDIGDIARVVDAVAVPVNVLILPGGPPVSQLTDAGVRRISVGSALAGAAFGAVAAAARELLDAGTIGATTPMLDRTLSRRAWS